MSHEDIIRAWKDEKEQNSLSKTVDSLFTELPEDVEESIAGGLALSGVCHSAALVSTSVGFSI